MHESPDTQGFIHGLSLVGIRLLTIVMQIIREALQLQHSSLPPRSQRSRSRLRRREGTKSMHAKKRAHACEVSVVAQKREKTPQEGAGDTAYKGHTIIKDNKVDRKEVYSESTFTWLYSAT